MKIFTTLLLSCLLSFVGLSVKAQYTATISGSISNLGADTVIVYADSMANAFFGNANSGIVVASNNNYSLTISTYNSPLAVWVWMVNCKGDTLVDSTVVSLNRRQVGQMNFNNCSSTPPPAKTKVEGTVYLGRNVATSGKVLLIEKDSGILTAVDTASLSISGFYSFTLPNASKDYLVKGYLESSHASYSSYLPTYSTASLNWSGANQVAAGSSGTITRDINLVAGTNTGGPAFVGGMTALGANKVSAEGDPYVGALVMLLQNNKPVAYTYSDNKGEFAIDNLAYGTYTVYTEIMGLPTVSGVVTLSEDNKRVDYVRVTINSSGVTTDVEKPSSVEVSTDAQNLIGYPNPVNDIFTINLGESLAFGTVRVLDFSGKILVEKEFNNTEIVKVPFHDIDGGLYLVEVATANGTQVLKVAK